MHHACTIEEAADGGRGGALGQARGRPKSSLKGASKQMVESMSEKQLEEFASTKRKKLPEKKG